MWDAEDNKETPDYAKLVVKDTDEHGKKVQNSFEYAAFFKLSFHGPDP